MIKKGIKRGTPGLKCREISSRDRRFEKWEGSKGWGQNFQSARIRQQSQQGQNEKVCYGLSQEEIGGERGESGVGRRKVKGGSASATEGLHDQDMLERDYAGGGNCGRVSFKKKTPEGKRTEKKQRT